MRTQRLFLLVFALVTVFLSPVHADGLEDAEKQELARQEAFRSGFGAIVENLNYGYFDSFIAAIDQRDMVDRIYGLRLIDQKIKKQFNQNLELSRRPRQGGRALRLTGLHIQLSRV